MNDDSDTIIAEQMASGYTKKAVNNLVWEHSHSRMTMKDAEDLSVKILELLVDYFNKYAAGDTV